MPFTLVQAHAMCMILALMLFGSIGIFFARYGRSLRFGHRRQLLGKAVWFQIHRFLLSLTSLITLLGFLFILVRNGGKWLDPQISTLRFTHSVLGGTIVCCVIIQIWLALYRCHPNSRFRYIFDWSHRLTGFLVFGLSIPTIFLIVAQLWKNSTTLITLMSIWTGWIVLVIILFEKIEYHQRTSVMPVVNNERGDNKQQTSSGANNTAPDIELGTHANVGNTYFNFLKLILFLFHSVVSVVLSLSFIIIFSS